MLSEKEKLDTLMTLGIELNQVQDLDILMERILTQARRFVNADAGSIYIREGDRLHFSYTQNDTLQKRLAPGEKLIYSTFTLPINKNTIAGYVAKTGQTLNIPDVYAIDGDAPYGFNRKFDRASEYRSHSMLTIPLKTAQEKVLGILQVINAQDESNRIVPFSTPDQKMMLHFASIAAVALEKAQMTRDIILRMIQMAEMRDPKETGAHVNRVASYAVELFERWAYRRQYAPEKVEKARDVLRMSAMLHDVGKVGISDLILKKPGRFNNDEYEIMKQHTVLGARLFKETRSEFDEAAAVVALNHHERWDGKGYPGYISIDSGEPRSGFLHPETGKPFARGKQKEQIPLYGRIVALADVYDALCSRRVYKEPWDESRVLDTIERESGNHFDPELVEIFFSILDVIRSIRNRYADEP